MKHPVLALVAILAFCALGLASMMYLLDKTLTDRIERPSKPSTYHLRVDYYTSCTTHVDGLEIAPECKNISQYGDAHYTVSHQRDLAL